MIRDFGRFLRRPTYVNIKKHYAHPINSLSPERHFPICVPFLVTSRVSVRFGDYDSSHPDFRTIRDVCNIKSDANPASFGPDVAHGRKWPTVTSPRLVLRPTSLRRHTLVSDALNVRSSVIESHHARIVAKLQQNAYFACHLHLGGGRSVHKKRS